MQIINGKFERSALNAKARGGTEIIAERMAETLDQEMLKEFQIFVSRVEEPLDETKIRIYHLQDLPGDPASDHLKNGGWSKFHKLVFSSNWQMEAYINHYGIPWSHCIVIQNGITPIPDHEKPTDQIRLAYWSTPHRGLNILVPVFEQLCQKHDNIELDVYSSFNLYGWGQRDDEFKALFEACDKHPKINNHGAIPNDELRKRLEKTHILAYPSIWAETSCITLMEAMSARLACVHSNLAALSETSANWTMMYQYHEDLNQHANIFMHALDAVITNYNDESLQSRITSQKFYADLFYNWEHIKNQWNALLQSLINVPRELPKTSGQFFSYKTS